MNKLIFALIITLVSMVAAGSVCAGPTYGVAADCFKPVLISLDQPKPAKQIVVKETITRKIASTKVLCKGKSKGVERGCGPCPVPGFAVKWACAWATLAQGPEVEAKYEIIKKGKLVKEAKPKDDAWYGCVCPY